MKSTLVYALMVSSCVSAITAMETVILPADTAKMTSIAYGKMSQVKVTEALSTVDGAELQTSRGTSLMSSLVGRLPGLTILQRRGEPGAEKPEFFIRGKASLLDNGALVMVDGVDTGYDQISWSEVETVSVLKDAAALALYGLRGANGVVLITTRRGGVRAKPVVTFDARAGVMQPVMLPQFTSLNNYVNLYNEGRKNDGLTQYYSDEVIAGYADRLDPYLYPDVNWYNDLLRPSAPHMQYDLTFRGGNNIVRYFLMLGVVNEQGLYANMDPRQNKNANIDYTRYNVRSNVDVNVTKDFLVSLDLSARMVNQSQPNVATDSFWGQLANYTPFPMKAPNGEYASKAGSASNPAGVLYNGGYQSYHSRELSETLMLRHKLNLITPGLSVFGRVNFSGYFKTNYNKTREYATYEVALTPGSTPGSEAQYNLTMRGKYTDFGISQNSYWQWNRTNLEAGFDYSRTVGKHAFEGLLMFHQNYYRAQNVVTPYAQQRYMGRLHYAFDNRYLLELVASFSGSENLPPRHRWGFFPAVSAGWVASNESFLKGSDVVSFLKVRASTGLLGNDRTGSLSRFPYVQNFQSGSSVTIGGTLTSTMGSMNEGVLANPDFTWEQSFLSNVGIEVELFNRLTLEADLFIDRRSQILVPSAGRIPAYVGVSLPYTNDGEIDNKGMELTMRYADQIGKVSYYVGGNVAFVKSRVVNKNEEPRLSDYRWETGHPVGTQFGMICEGFYEESDFENGKVKPGRPLPLFGSVQPGDLKYKDMNGDGFVDDLDIASIGKAEWPELTYAVNAGVAYVGFDIKANLQGVGSRSIYLRGNAVVPFLDNARVSPWVAEGYWTPERSTAGTATFPRLTVSSNANNYQASTFWMRDGSFLRLRDLEVGYTLPARLTKKIKIDKVRFCVNANNLFSWQAMNDVAMDAEMMTINGYPITKSISAGLTVQF